MWSGNCSDHWSKRAGKSQRGWWAEVTGLKLSENMVQLLVQTRSRRDPEGRRLSCSGRQTTRVEELGVQVTGGPRPYLSCPCAILDPKAVGRAPTEAESTTPAQGSSEVLHTPRHHPQALGGGC